jgi:hypothetical protein
MHAALRGTSSRRGGASLGAPLLPRAREPRMKITGRDISNSLPTKHLNYN